MLEVDERFCQLSVDGLFEWVMRNGDDSVGYQRGQSPFGAGVEA